MCNFGGCICQVSDGGSMRVSSVRLWILIGGGFWCLYDFRGLLFVSGGLSAVILHGRLFEGIDVWRDLAAG